MGFGYLTTTITVMDADRKRVEDKVRAVERVVNGLGFTCIRETLNAAEAWLSSLPGQVYANVRQPLVHTLNLAHLMAAGLAARILASFNIGVSATTFSKRRVHEIHHAHV